MAGAKPQLKHRNLSVRYVPLSDISSWERNPKSHDDISIYESMMRFGFTSPVIVNESTGKLLAGHGRIKVLRDTKRLGGSPPEGIQINDDGEWLVPVVGGVSLEGEDEHGAYVLADNRTSENGGWLDQELAAVLEQIESTVGLHGTGFTDQDLEALLKRGETEDREPTDPEMELRPFEHYDYIVLLFRDARDWMRAHSLFNLQKVNASASRKNTKIGIGRVIDGARLFEVIDENTKSHPE